MNQRRLNIPAGLVILLFSILFLLGAEAEETNRAGLVIDFGNGQVETACVRFAGADISGFDLLQQSGLPVEVEAQGLGAAVCRIGETGCPAGNCFCACRGEDCTYWSYWHQINGEWEYSAAGAGTYRVKPGAVEGWTWGPGSVTEAVEPPMISFAEICTAPPAQTVAQNPSASSPQEQTQGITLNWLPYLVVGLVLVGLLLGGFLLRRTTTRQP